MPCHPLTKSEKRTLARLEKLIQAHRGTVEKVCAAFVQIRNDRLYRDEYPTFESYCRKRWKITARSAYYRITQVEVSENLRSASQEPVALSVRQAEALKALPPEGQREVYEQAQNPEDADELKRLADQWADDEIGKIQEEEAQALESRATSPRKSGRDLLERIEETVGRLEKLWARIDQAEFAEELKVVKKKLLTLVS